MAAVQSCLRIWEVSREIVGQIDSSATLVAVACSCRALQEHALDNLWRSQATFENLVRVVPAGRWSLDHAGSGVNGVPIIPIRQPLRPGDLDRFAFYARRIISLGDPHINNNPSLYLQASRKPWTLSSEFFANIRAQYPTFTPFKRLVVFTCLAELIPDSSFSSWELFITPTLRSFTLLPDRRHLGPAFTCIQLLQANPPSICYFRISIRYNQPVANNLSNVLNLLRDLQSLTLHVCKAPLHVKTLEAIASLPNLQSLTIYFSAEITLPIESSPTAIERIRASVPHLRIVSTNVEPACAFLSRLRLADVDRAHAVFTIPAPSTVHDYFSALAAAMTDHPSSLRALVYRDAGPFSDTVVEGSGVGGILDFDSDDGELADGDVPVRPFADISPALSFSELAILDVVSASDFTLDDTAIGAMAAAWPHIEVLSVALGPYLVPDEPPAATLRALIPLAAHCPALHTLRLRVDATADPPPISEGIVQRALRFFEPVNSVRGPDPESTARFILALFPDVLLVGSEGGHEFGWSGVEQTWTSTICVINRREKLPRIDGSY
ncbi:hypothetical protein C8Q77DRAFT_236811 [Trametes polyzona]|nr:hypothetical protein C8Q77DRAFT_236811 [Trametes polyzona]